MANKKKLRRKKTQKRTIKLLGGRVLKKKKLPKLETPRDANVWNIFGP